MANRNTQGFGLIPAGTLGSTPATSGQGKYKIDAGYATTIFHGGCVASAAGYIVEGQNCSCACTWCLKWHLLQRGNNVESQRLQTITYK